MTSVLGSLLKSQIRLIKPILTNLSVEKMRTSQDKLGELGAKGLASKAKFDDFKISEIPACLITPNKMQVDAEDKIIFYLHGGAYVAGNLDYARGFAGVLATTLNIRVLCIAYRLAPEHPYPAAIDDAEAAYDYLLQNGHSPENISFVGESAGGGLLMALALKLRDTGKPLPGKLIPISPWTDLTLSGESYRTNEQSDPSLAKPTLEHSSCLYAPNHLSDPYVSPLFGDMTGLPPTLIIVGRDEILLDDSRNLFNKLRDVGCDCEIIISDGMWHAFPLYGIPEAKTAIGRIFGFVIREKLHE